MHCWHATWILPLLHHVDCVCISVQTWVVTTSVSAQCQKWPETLWCCREFLFSLTGWSDSIAKCTRLAGEKSRCLHKFVIACPQALLDLVDSRCTCLESLTSSWNSKQNCSCSGMDWRIKYFSKPKYAMPGMKMLISIITKFLTVHSTCGGRSRMSSDAGCLRLITIPRLMATKSMLDLCAHSVWFNKRKLPYMDTCIRHVA